MYSDAKRRKRQINAIIDYAEGEEYLAVIGDFNEEPLPFSTRRKLGSIGLESAFVRSGLGHPVTLPTPAYKRYRTPLQQAGFELLGGGVRYDDIYVSSSMKVRKVGTIDADSDHRFVYAAVSTPHGIYMDRTHESGILQA
jgi:hypothetical protein